MRFRRALNEVLLLLGFDARKLITFLRQVSYYTRTLAEYRRQERLSERFFSPGRLLPCLEDRQAAGGTARGHYFHQDLLVARRVFANKPARHVDVGSRIDGFVAHVASFRPIDVIDVRPTLERIPNVTFMKLDLTRELAESFVDSCDSLSCLHALEHFGLGRYGDRIQYLGYLAGLDNLRRILKKGGKLYLSVPIGPQRIEFNAHRVFSVRYLLDLFKDRFRVDAFSYVDDEGLLHEAAALEPKSVEENFGCFFGCGIFEMTKQ